MLIVAGVIQIDRSRRQAAEQTFEKNTDTDSWTTVASSHAVCSRRRILGRNRDDGDAQHSAGKSCLPPGWPSWRSFPTRRESPPWGSSREPDVGLPRRAFRASSG